MQETRMHCADCGLEVDDGPHECPQQRAANRAAQRRELRATVTLRCQRCDSKLTPARARQVPQIVRRECREEECGAVWSVHITPRHHTVDGQTSLVHRPEYREVIA